ncbi:hypothetical protein OH77DRAFT_1524605 [Trametes cingulata]|nr:hypothetical protein OH77DRAFT_1524605 [Trametes cingulata]
MSAPVVSQLRLPVELLDIVIDFLQADWRTLAVCALVGPDWASRALKHLSSPNGITLTLHSPECGEADDLAHMTTSGSLLANTIRGLTIQGSSGDVSDYPPFPQSLAILGHLSGLRSLTLRLFLVQDAEHLVSVILASSSLEDLNVESLSLDVTSSASRALAARIFVMAPRVVVLPRLVSLRVTDHKDAMSGLLFEVLAAYLNAVANPTFLRFLSIHADPRHGGTPADPDIELWYLLITGAHSTLTHLSLTLPAPMDSFAGEIDCARFTRSFICCPHLRCLTLRYLPPNVASEQHARFIGAFQRFFRVTAHAKPAFAAALEQLAVVVPHSAIRANLAEVAEQCVLLGPLLNSDAYPALSAVTIGVYHESCNQVDVWLDAEVQDGMKRLKSALYALEERGVSVQVKAMEPVDWEHWPSSLRTTDA